MRWNDIYIGGAAAALGRVETTESAVADGRYDAEQNLADGYLSARVSDRPAVELAVDAARIALERSGVPASDVGMVMHTCMAHQGLDHFAPASYVQSRTVGGLANAIEVRQASNGGMGAIDLAAAFLTAQPAVRALLVTSGDVFPPPAYRRYGRDAGGVLLSDGGTALVLQRAPGFAKLLSTVVIGDTEHHGLYNDNAPFTDAPGAGGWPIDLAGREERYIEQLGGPEAFVDIVRTLDERQQDTVRDALADADLTVPDIDWWVFPNVGATLVDWETYKEMGIDETRTTTEWGRRVAHLGGGDQIAGLAYLVESGTVRPGERVLLNAAGQGFTFGSAVLEILDVPDWPNTAD